MTTTNLDYSQYWENRYVEKKIGWDIGYANKVLTSYVESNHSKESKILVPGAGHAYEVASLFNSGYKHIEATDFSISAKENFIVRNPTFPEEQYLLNDFFKLKGSYDVILEQTFFCAINPELREAYVEQMHNLLNEGGVLYGLLFVMDKPDGPPYGGTTAEYIKLFSSKFEIKQMVECTESIEPRLGTEIIIELIKK